MSSDARPIRVVIQQPALPQYRVPVFRALAQRPGIDLCVVYGDAPGAPSNAEPEGFVAKFAPIQSFLGGRLLWQGASWTHATRKRADVLVLTWNVRFLSLLPALLRAKLSGVKTILWGHGYSKRESRWRQRIRNRVALFADALLFYNHGAAERFIAGTGCDSLKVHVALNCLDQIPIQEARASWLADEGRLIAFRAEHRLGPGPVILFVSRLCADNRVDLLIEATEALTRDFHGVTVVLIGGGNDEGRLQEVARARGMEAHVRFLGPIYGEHLLAPWFLNADVFCYPANIGLSILHAFGYGLPVVTSDRFPSQNPEIEALRPGENGLTFHDVDARSLAAALRLILTNAELRARLSHAALHTAAEQFSLDRMVGAIERSVRSVLRGARSAASSDGLSCEGGSTR